MKYTKTQIALAVLAGVVIVGCVLVVQFVLGQAIYSAVGQ